MGYCATSVKTDISWDLDRLPEVVGEGVSIADARERVSEILESGGWEVEIYYPDASGGFIDTVWFDGSVHVGTLDALESIAPIVDTGSAIFMKGDDDCFWAYYFTGSTCYEREAELVISR